MKKCGSDGLCLIAIIAAVAVLPCLTWADSASPGFIPQDKPAATALSDCLTLDPYTSTSPPDVIPSALNQTSTPVLSLDAAPAGGTSSTPVNDEAELAKKTLNPVADLISVPFQYNVDFNIGPKKASRSTLNIQPVVPIHLDADWNLITRTIVPVVYADSPAPGVNSEWGLGDITASFFLSPRKEVGGWILGAGPVFLLPTATNDVLGSGQWGAGVTGVALRQTHGWTYGILANQIWSYANTGNDNPPVNATYLQPFLVYTFPTFTSVGVNTESTYDWTSHQWIVPINLFATQIIKVGKLPLSLQFGGRCYAEGPTGAPDWGLRFQITFLFPNK